MAITLNFRKLSHVFTHFSNNVSKQAVTQSANKQGKVYLIGAGPGDPELLTLKAFRLIQQADVILIDWLVGEGLYAIFPEHAERLFVGKKCGKHSMKQADINQLMVKRALAGDTVVRLKGGDPSVFGRLAEETDTLTEHNIPFAIVPGVTAASGIAAYTGIPLTHRENAQSVKFITAHLKDGGIGENWETLAKETSTLVFYMGLNRVAQIQASLLSNGMASDMPIAVIDQGTTSNQQTLCSTLSTLNADVALSSFSGPALIIVGEVVSKKQAVDLALLHSSSLEPLSL